MTPDLILFLSIIALFFLVGLPLITRRVWLPVELVIEDVADADLTDRQRIYFDALDTELSDLHFRAARTFSVTNLQGPNLVRTYLSEAEPAMIHAMALRTEDEAAELAAMNYIEVATRFADGSSMSTRNGDVSSVFNEPPHIDVAVRRSLSTASALKAAHDKRVSSEQHREPRYATADQLFDLLREHHERWSQFQVESGRLRHDVEANLLRPTIRTGLQGISNYLNPFADNLTVVRFFLALLGGIAIPVLGILYLADPSGLPLNWLTTTAGLSITVGRWLALGVVFTFLGLVSGSLFSGKTFLWTFLLAWFPLRLLGPSITDALVLSLWAGFVATTICRRKMRRETLV